MSPAGQCSRCTLWAWNIRSMKGLSSSSWMACTLQAPSNGSVSLLEGRACHCNGLPAAGCAEVDRKSTRLNSSHSQISYAVFCLKKKKQTNDERCDHVHHVSATLSVKRNLLKLR